MKVYVDKIPEHPKDCFFSQFEEGKTAKEDVYKCQITRKICPYYKEGWTKTCPCLIEHKDSFNGCYTSISSCLDGLSSSSRLSNYSNKPTTLEF